MTNFLRMRLLFIFLIASFSGNAQNNTSVVIPPTTAIQLDSSRSYIYCATMEIMWHELSNYLGKKPKTTIKNSSIDLLNESVSQKYQVPIEPNFVVAMSGLVKDSILEKINSQLEHKFQTNWTPAYNLSPNTLVSYSFLKKDVKFYYNLDDKFYDQAFNNGSIVNVDYFGINEGNPNASRKDILIYDYKNSDDFIVQVKCRDSLDEIYFAKIPLQISLSDAYQTVLKRVNSDNWELFNGGDILKIPYIKFDTTTNFTDIEGATLEKGPYSGKTFQHVSQRISFDLNHQGITLESSAYSYLDFDDSDNPPPRVLAFDKPFLIIMKRKGADLPYFMYWVSGVEFMRSYILKTRVLMEVEHAFVGKWHITEKILADGTVEINTDYNQVYDFKSDGTFECYRRGYEVKKGAWNYADNVLSLEWLNSNVEKDNKIELKLIDCTSDKFTIDGKTKLVFKKQ